MGAIYENDEAMAQLGRDLMDMLAGQRRMGRSDASVAPTLLATVSEHLAEDESEEDEPEPVDEEERLDHDHSMDG